MTIMEHYQDDADKSQELVTGITGTMHAAPDRDDEMEQQAVNTERIRETERELREALNGNVPLVRTIAQGTETIFRGVLVPANVATQLLAKNFRRCMATLTGTGANVAIGADPSLSWSNGAAPISPMNGTTIGYTASFFVREVKSSQDVWCISDAAVYIGIQEEFYA